VRVDDRAKRSLQASWLGVLEGEGDPLAVGDGVDEPPASPIAPAPIGGGVKNRMVCAHASHIPPTWQAQTVLPSSAVAPILHVQPTIISVRSIVA
jgi:hypothetical protein